MARNLNPKTVKYAVNSAVAATELEENDDYNLEANDSKLMKKSGQAGAASLEQRSSKQS